MFKSLLCEVFRFSGAGGETDFYCIGTPRPNYDITSIMHVYYYYYLLLTCRTTTTTTLSLLIHLVERSEVRNGFYGHMGFIVVVV